jgi:hypothetical protein
VASVASLSPLLAAQAVGSRPDGPLNGARLAEAVTVASAAPPTSSQW